MSNAIELPDLPKADTLSRSLERAEDFRDRESKLSLDMARSGLTYTPYGDLDPLTRRSTRRWDYLKAHEEQLNLHLKARELLRRKPQVNERLYDSYEIRPVKPGRNRNKRKGR